MQQARSTPLQLPNTVARDLFRPHDPTRPVKPAIVPDSTQALKDLRAQIAGGCKEERELALDILVNLAADEGEQGKAAQKTLREVYANPGCTDPGQNTPTRRRIEDLSLELCKLALNPPSRTDSDRAVLFGGQNELGFDNFSMTVAYLGGRAQLPPDGKNGGAMQGHIEQHIENKLAKLDEGARPYGKNQYLGAARSTEFAELHAASQNLTHLKVNPDSLNMQFSNASGSQKQFVEPLENMIADMRKTGDSCRAVMINTGHNEFAHWMTLVVELDDDDDVVFHVVDTDKTACEERGIPQKLNELLDQVDPVMRKTYASDVQKREVCAQACGVLGYGLLEALDQQMGSGKAVHVGNSIEDYMDKLNESTDDDLGAQVVSTRAHLLDAWAGGANPSPQPVARKDVMEVLMANTPVPVVPPARPLVQGLSVGFPEPILLASGGVALPAGEQPAPASAEIQNADLLGASPPPGEPGDPQIPWAPPDATPPADEAAVRLQRYEAVFAQPADAGEEDRFAGLVGTMKIGRSPAPGGGYVSTLGEMCASLNTLRVLGEAPAGANGKNQLEPQRMRQREVKQDQFCKGQPESFQPVLTASLQLDRTVAALQANDGSPLIKSRGFELTPDLASKVQKLQLNAGSWIQKVTGLELQMKTLMGHAEGATNPDKDKAAMEFMRFEKILAEIGTTINDRVKSLEEDLKVLNGIIDHGKDWFDGRGAYGVGHSQVQADAEKLRDALVPWLAALKVPNGEVNKLATFAREATQHPREAIEAIQAKVIAPLHMLA